jgi:type IV pilus assembly protein PilF
MRRAVLGIIALLSVSACSSGIFSSSPSSPQKPAEEEPDSRRPTPPRDNRTRAKLHTELGSLYLQSQNLSVALEELTMAIVVDPDYAPAMVRVDWCFTISARWRSPTGTFNRP